MCLAFGRVALQCDRRLAACAQKVVGQEVDANIPVPVVSLTTLLVDAGYVTNLTVALCDQLGITLYGPWRENDYSKAANKGKKPRPLGKEHFHWNAEENMYRCPEGHPMPQIGIQRRRQADDQIDVMHSYLRSAKHCMHALASRVAVPIRNAVVWSNAVSTKS